MLAIAGLTGGGLFLRGTVLREPRKPLRTLTQAEFSIVAAFADRICPANGAFPAAWDVGVPEEVDKAVAALHPGLQAEFKQALLLIENALFGLLLDQRITPFTACSPEVQDEVIANFRDSQLEIRRVVYRAVKGLCVGAYYTRPAVFPAVGYPGPPDYGQSALTTADVHWSNDRYRPPEPAPEPEEEQPGALDDAEVAP